MTDPQQDPNASPEIDRDDPDLSNYLPPTPAGDSSWNAWPEGKKKPLPTNVTLEEYRGLIVIYASLEDDSVAPISHVKRKGAERLKRYFEKGIKGWGSGPKDDPRFDWSEADLKILEQARGRPKDAQWCGIFAASILSDAGLPVKFTWSRGLTPDWEPEHVGGKVTDPDHHTLAYDDFVKRVEPGDVVITNATYYDKKQEEYVRSNHHCIVIGIDREGQRVNCVNGNYGTGADPDMQAVKAEWRPMSDINGGEWYSLEKLVPPK